MTRVSGRKVDPRIGLKCIFYVKQAVTPTELSLHRIQYLEDGMRHSWDQFCHP